MTMTLAQKIAAMKSGNPIATKLQPVIETRGPITNAVELTASKFEAIEAMRKDISNHGLMIEKIMASISTVSSDMVAISGALNQLNKAYTEHGNLIVEIMANSKAIRSQLDSFVNRSNSPKQSPPAITPPAVINRGKQSPAIVNDKGVIVANNQTQSGDDYQTLFNLFMGEFKTDKGTASKFAKSTEYTPDVAAIWRKLVDYILSSGKSPGDAFNVWWNELKNQGVYHVAMTAKANAKKAIEFAFENMATEENPPAVTPPQSGKKSLPKLTASDNQLDAIKAKAVEENSNDRVKRLMPYFLDQICQGNKTDFGLIFDALKTEEVNPENKGQVISLIYDWLRDKYSELKRSSIAALVEFYIDDQKAIRQYMARH